MSRKRRGNTVVTGVYQCERFIEFYEGVARGSADVVEGCHIPAWAPHSEEPSQQGRLESEQASLPPSPTMTSSFGLQKYLKLFCSQSVPGLPGLLLSQPTLQWSFMSHSTFFAHTLSMFSLFHFPCSESKLTVAFRNRSWLVP